MVVRMNKGDAIVRERPRLVPSSPSYTLAELIELAKQWRDENGATTDAQWVVSHLFQWLAKREQGEVKGR